MADKTKSFTKEWIAWATKHKEADDAIAKEKLFSGARMDAVQVKHDIGPEPTRYKE